MTLGALKDKFIAFIISPMTTFVQIVVNVPTVSGVFDYVANVAQVLFAEYYR